MEIVPQTSEERDEEFDVPWFPRHPQQLDKFANKTMDFSDDLASDHPGFHDEVYRERRTMIVKKVSEEYGRKEMHQSSLGGEVEKEKISLLLFKAKEYRYGNPLPDVDYTDEEKDTWRQVFSHLKQLYPTHACTQFQKYFFNLFFSFLFFSFLLTSVTQQLKSFSSPFLSRCFAELEKEGLYSENEIPQLQNVFPYSLVFLILSSD